MEKVDILAIGVHPDDIELACSGTLLKHIDQGKTVGLLDLTKGELGTRGSAEIRAQESAESARLMGAKFRVNAGLADGFFQYNPDSILKIIEIIRSCSPEIVLANAINDRHPDHGRAAKLTADACYYSGLAKIESRDPESNELQERWRPSVVYHYIQDYSHPADFVVDISDYLDRKFELIKAFRSQFFVPEATEYKTELQSPISTKQFWDFLSAKSATYGRPAGFDHGEGFTVNRTIGVQNIFDLV